MGIAREPSETLLVVDDEEMVLRVCEALLRRAGYSVLIAADGHQALATCAAHHRPLHLALLDVVMPGMDLTDLQNCLREGFPEVRILYMSGSTYQQITEKGIQMEPRDYLQKPFKPETLLHCIRETLDRPKVSGAG